MSVREIYNEDYPPPFLIESLLMLENAIRNVTNNYCVWEYNQSLQKVERVFAYELYHQLRILFTDDLNIAKLRFDGEINKRLNDDVEDCGVDKKLLIKTTEKRNKSSEKQTNFSPDLVLHLGQNDRLENNQSLIIEIKTKKVDDSEFAKDLLKLNHYIRLLNFQYAVFISVNTDFIELKQQIRNIFVNEDEWKDRFNQIVIFNYSNRNLQANSLQKILEE